MKKSGKRILTILLSIMIIMTYMVPGSVFADTAGASEETATAEVHEHDHAIEELSEGADDSDVVISDDEDPPVESEGEIIEEVPEAIEAEEPAEEVTEEPAEELPAAEETVAINDKAKAAAEEAPAVKAGTGGLSVLAFTSDTHNTSSNSAANRLGTWLDKMTDIYGAVDVMAFGGDMADAGASATSFWTYTQADMDKLDDRGIPGVYTTGNHEYSPGSYTHDRNSTTQKYIEDQQGYEGPNYRIYCLGSAGSSWNQYSNSQITTLTNYLNTAGNDKPIIIITHYPLHYYGSRTISGASSIIDVLNNAVNNNGQKIVYLWGHNHTESDSNYDEVFEPGDKLSYSNGSSKEINFYYGAAGCMSDRDYGTGSGSVKGKGLIITINSKNQLSFAYHNADGLNVTENGNDGQGSAFTEQDPVYATSMSLSAQTATVEVGRTLKPKLEVSFLPADTNFKAVTWTSSDPSKASVDSTGKVKGVSQGTATITATYALEGSSLSASCTVEVVPRTTTDPEYVIRIGNYALSTEHSSDSYSSGSSGWGGSTNTYNGMVAVPYTAGSGADDSIRWILEESDDGNGYYIKSSDDRYLNATYESSGSSWYGGNSTSDLKLDDTPDVWTFDGDLDDWLVDGSKLKSANTDRYLAEVTGSAGTHIITTRSSDSAATTIGELASDPVAVTGVSVTPATASVKERETVQLTATVAPADATNKKVTWSSSNTSIATVDEKGLVKGVAEGSVTITATTVDGSFSAASTVTIIHNDNPSVEETISITPSTDNPEQSITINVGDTLVINTTNGSSNSGYNYTATLTNSSVAQIQGNATIEIAAGATGQFTVAGIADGTVDINIQNDQSSSQYVRKAVIHLTVGSGSTPVDPPTGDTVNITPSTDNPEQSIKINVGDTLTINTTNGSSREAYDFTATVANTSIAQIQGSSSVTIAAGGTGQFTVKGIAEGTTDITIRNNNTQYGANYERIGVIHLTVGEGTTPVDPPVGDTVTYQLTDSLDADKEYIIANGNIGSVYVLSNQANGSRKLKAISATVSGDQITLSASDAAKATFTAEGKTSTSGSDSAWLKNGSQYLYTNNADGLRVSSDQTATDNTGKYWHYKADGKNLLWYFKDTSSSDGYTDTSGTYKYYLEVSGSDFTDNHVSSTSLANSNTPKIYLFVKDDSTPQPHVHTYGEPTWTWTGNVKSRAAVTAIATFTCEECGEQFAIAADVASATDSSGHVVYTATVTGPDGKTYTDTKAEAEEGKYTITISADKTEVTPGDEVTFTITLGPVDKFGSFQMTPVIPEGLTYVSNSFKPTGGRETLKATLGYDDVDWTESTMRFTGFTLDNDYVSTSDTVLATFKCTVDSGFTSSATVDLTRLEFYSSTDWTYNMTDQYEIVPVTVVYTAHTHTAGTAVRENEVQPTCTTAGGYDEVVYCTSCGEEMSRTHVDVAATGHNMTAHAAVAATCTTAGNSAYWSCDKCGKYFSDAQGTTEIEADSWVIAATGHNMTAHAAVAATCTTAGNSAYWSCDGCGKYFSDAQGTTEIEENSWVIAATGHNMTAHAAVAATCETAGNSAYWSCDKCGKYFSDAQGTTEIEENSWVIAATGHDWEFVKFTWAEAGDSYTAVANYKCKNDDSHTTTANATVTDESTSASCETAGSVVYTATVAAADSPDKEAHTDTKTVESAVLGHDLTAHAAVAATCETAGNSAYWTCKRCGKHFSDAEGKTAIEADSWIIPATGHDYGELIAEAAATCTTDGVKAHYECSVCHKLFDADKKETTEEALKIAALGHNMTAHATVAATCTTAGNSAYWSCDRCGKYFSDEAGNTEIEENSWVIAALGHKLEAHPAAAATCETAGNSAYWSCGRCGKFFSDAEGEFEIAPDSWVIAATGHDYGELIAEAAATCTADGVKAHYECGTCHKLFDADKKETTEEALKIAALGHNMTAHAAAAATCETAGNSAYWSCDRCGKYFSDEAGTTEIAPDSWVIPATGHDYGELIAEVAATCTTDGVKAHYVCGTCHKLFDEEKEEITEEELKIEALGHEWGEPFYGWNSDNTKVTAIRKCTRDESHEETETVDATYEVVKEATENISGLGRYTSEEFENPAFKVQTKDIVLEPTGYKVSYEWSDDKSSVKATAVPYSTSLETVTETVETTSEVTTQPTCTNNGIKKYTAVFTNEQFGNQTATEEIPALGHEYGELIAEVAATCTTDGVKAHYECGRCHKFFDADKKETTEEALKIAALGHNMTAHAAVAATCETAGNSAYWSCDRCGKYFSDAEGKTAIEADSWIIPATGHDYGELIVEVAATCTTGGMKAHYECGRCHKLFDADKKETTEEALKIAALGHNMTAHAAVAATCETAGNSAYWSCDRCGKYFSDAEGKTAIEADSWIIPATGHDYGELIVEVAATCTTGGMKAHYECGRCHKLFDADKKETTEEALKIAALGHNMTAHAAVAATCETAGNSAYWSCDRCGKYFSDAEGKTTIEADSWKIPATGHTIVTDPGKAATCVETGLTEGSHCSVCGKVLVAQEETPLAQHSWGEPVMIKEPVYLTPGLFKYTCTVCGETVEKENGWVKTDEGDWIWRFIKETGEWAANEWVYDHKGWCWIQEDGICAVDTWFDDPVSGNTYYLKHGGYRAINEWIYDGKNWYYMDKDGISVKAKWLSWKGDWYYLKADGAMAANEWAMDSVGTCWMESSGKMAKSKWIQADGEWYYMNASGYITKNAWAKDSKGWCWMDANGKITKSKWIKDGGEWYYLKPNGYMAVSEWAKDSKGWMYMDGSGKITKSKWILYKGDWYYLKADGYMATGTQTIGGTTYRFDSSGRWIS